MAHLAVVRDGVVVKMPSEFQFGLLQEFALLSSASLSLQPFCHLFQFCSILLSGGLPFHFEVAVACVSAVMREAEEVKCLRPLSTAPRPFFSEPTELQQSRLGCFQLQMKLRQPFPNSLRNLAASS